MNKTPLKTYRHSQIESNVLSTPLTPFSASNRNTNHLSAPEHNNCSGSPYRSPSKKDLWVEKQKESWALWFNECLLQSTNEHCGFLNLSLEKNQREMVLREKSVVIMDSLSERFKSIEKLIDDGLIEFYPSEIKNIREDVGVRYNFVQLIMVYENLYLRLALEVLFNEVFNITGTLENHICKFIEKRILLYNEICESGLCDKQRDELNDSLNKKTMRNVLCLILLLDHLKINNVLKYCPSLFVNGSKIHSSCNFLEVLLKEYAVKPKKTSQYLKSINYELNYTVKPFEEYRYNVVHFDEDFRDGVRLARMAEILSKDDFISGNLKIPANTRHQRLQNMKQTFTKLREIDGVEMNNEITESAIVDGDFNVTSKLLWNIFCLAELPKIELSAESILKELKNIGGVNRFKDSQVLRYNNDLVSNLLRWCISIGLNYGIEVKDFDNSFFDGTLYAFILHFYKPELVNIEQVKHYGQIYKELLNSGKEEESIKLKKKFFDEILFPAIQNLKLIPWIISSPKVTDKIIIIFVGYLYERLISSKYGRDPLNLSDDDHKD